MLTLVRPLAPLPTREPMIPAARPSSLDDCTVHLILSMPHGSGFETALAEVQAGIAERFPRASIVVIVRHDRYMGDDPGQRAAISDAPHPCAAYFGSPTGALNLVGVDYCAKLEGASVPTTMIVPSFALAAASYAAEALGCALALVTPQDGLAEVVIRALLDRPTALLPTGAPHPTFDVHDEDHGHTVALKEEWGDGLPILLPSVDKVAAMLEGTRREAGTVVADNLGPNNRTATVGLVAANAVMAGARAKDMPLLLAATEAFGVNPAIRTMLGSVNGFCFPFVVNGPIRAELGLESGYAALNANANRAIERALHLIMQNVIGIRPGVTAFPVQGHPAGTSFLIVENEETSPWPPFVDQSERRSAMTLFGGGWSHIGTYFYPEEGLDGFAEALAHLEMPHSALILMSPARAALLAGDYPDKAALAEAIRQKTLIEMKSFRRSGYYAGRIRDRIKSEGTWPSDYLYRPDTDRVPAYPPDGIRIVVNGSEISPIITAWKLEPLACVSPDDWR